MTLSSALLLGTCFIAACAAVGVLLAVLTKRRGRSPVSRDFSAPRMPYAGIIDGEFTSDLPFAEERRRR